MTPERKRLCVLVLGGWSPGPLDALSHRLHAEADFHEPTIPMPPCGLRWCLNPFWVLFVAYLFLAIPRLMDAADASAGSSEALAWGLRCGVVTVTCGVLRLLIAGIVWFSIRDTLRIASDRIEQLNPDVLVGFSWGGGIACWLLAERRWTGPTVLLAPTLHKICAAACASVPSFSVQDCHVSVFHANGDPFCPDSQIDTFRGLGCEVQCFDDSHILCSRAALDRIGARLRQVLAGAGAREAAERTALLGASEAAHSSSRRGGGAGNFSTAGAARVGAVS